MALLRLRHTLAAVLVALVSFILYRGITRPPPRIEPRRKEAQPHSKNTREPVRGSAHQKSDVFAELVTQQFPDITADAALQLYPRKFEAHGHVVVARMNTGVSAEQFRPLASCFAQSFAPITVDVVLLDEDGIAGELRKPQLDVLYAAPADQISYPRDACLSVQKRWRESRARGAVSCVAEDDVTAWKTTLTRVDTFTLHVENGVRYSFDVCKVMFCSGNTTERMHFAEVDATGEVVVDMFAGIGYFTLPLAMHGKPIAIHALEKNPDSVVFLKFNSVQNRVDHLIRPQCGDNRVVGDELVGKCDRVIMGYIPTCKEFLPRAIDFLKHNEDDIPQGTVHYHFLADKNVARAVVLDELKEELGAELVLHHAKITQLRNVKSYAPKRFHFVADVCFA